MDVCLLKDPEVRCPGSLIVSNSLCYVFRLQTHLFMAKSQAPNDVIKISYLIISYLILSYLTTLFYLPHV